MDVTTLHCGIDVADKIYHVSDVHIRTLKRHREYKQVFDNLFDYINSTKTSQSIAVVTGDIVHSKLEMSPELIRMLTGFFNAFTLPTIVILGNHDMNLNNHHREDALSPIIDMIQNPNIYFVKENGLFDFAGIRWNHMAVDVEPSKYIRGDQFTASYRKIALHHGAVNSAVTDIGYEISNEHVNITMFDSHDMTLLGDIHKPAQFLNAAKTIAYPGSLIQQSHGEAMHHGILVWDVATCSAEFVEIDNEYGYVTFEVHGTTLVNPPRSIPSKPRVRIKFTDTSAADIKKFITLLRSKYDVQDISIQRATQNNSTTADTMLSIGNVRDVEYQNKLITEYIERVYPQVTAAEIDAVRHINRTINSKLPQLDSVRHVTWTPLSFEFENMFSYGENNVIDFTKVTDVAGLFAPNTSGKSSLLDAITYTIFDKCSKTGKAHEVLNNKKTSFKGIFKFQLHDTVYTIEREGIQQKNGHVKVIVNFYTDAENLNGEERSDTNKNIRKYLGTYDDFILTAFSLQNDSNNFINKSQRERKDLLSQFLDITVFEQLYLFASDEIRETAGKLKEYKRTDFSVIITDADEVINKNKDFIIEKEQLESVKNSERNDIQNKILTLIETKLPTTYSGPDIDVLSRSEKKITAEIETLHTAIERHESDIEVAAAQVTQLKKQIKQYNVVQLETACTQLQQYREQLQNNTKLIHQITEVINAKQEKIKHLSEHEYDPNCKYCTSNVFVQNAIQAQNTIDDDFNLLTELTATQTELQQHVDALTDSETELTAYNALRTKLQTQLIPQLERMELQLQVTENELQTKESELETVHVQQEQFMANETAIHHNKQIDSEIALHKTYIEQITNELKQIGTAIKTKHGEIEVAKTNRNMALQQLETYKQLEIEYKAVEYYLQSVKRDGVPYELVSQAIPKIEAEINNVLNQIVDFNLVLQADGKNINGYIIYDEDNMWPLELTSGMERFISSLAIRIGLINVSALPRPNFIAIDEGWGSLDADHISSVVNLFEYLRTKFDFAIIISHVDSMRDMVDSLLEVNKIDSYSQIIHT
jgi:DNA repair exonuclease SbcCD ATPase subunit